MLETGPRQERFREYKSYNSNVINIFKNLRSVTCLYERKGSYFLFRCEVKNTWKRETCDWNRGKGKNKTGKKCG